MVGSSLGQCKLFSWSLARLWLQHVTCNIQDLCGCGYGKGARPLRHSLTGAWRCRLGHSLYIKVESCLSLSRKTLESLFQTIPLKFILLHYCSSIRGAKQMAHPSQTSFGTRFQRFAGPIPHLPFDQDVEMEEAEPAPAESSSHLIVAFDFGTTFSSVAYALVSDKTPRDTVDITDVRCIARYPDDRPQPGVTFGWEPREDVPTELWYSLPQTPKHKQLAQQSMQISEEESMNEDPSMSDVSSEFSCSFQDDAENLENEEESSGGNGGRSDPLFWGFGVQKQLQNIDIPKDGTRRITRFKLMLDEKSEETEDIRAELLPILKNLKKSKLIKHNTDVITDYLEQLFRHTKDELRRLNKYNVNIPIEFVLCVPAVWPARACRAMQAAMSSAAKRSELGSLVDGCLDNLFIISEPEAAAACVLAEDNNDIYVGYSSISCKAAEC